MLGLQEPRDGFSRPYTSFVDNGDPTNTLAIGLKWGWVTPQSPRPTTGSPGRAFNIVPAAQNTGGTPGVGGLPYVNVGNGVIKQSNRFGYVWDFASIAGTPFQMYDTNTDLPTPYKLKSGGTHRMTIAAWVKPSAKDQCIAYHGPNNTGFRTWDLYCDVTTGFAHFCVNNTSNTLSTATGYTNIADGNWHFIVGTFGGDGGPILLYVDGRLEASATYSGTIQDQSGGVLIGAYPSNASIMLGQLASIMYWNRSIGSAEVQTLFGDPNVIFHGREILLSPNLSGTGAATLPHPFQVTAAGGMAIPGNGDVTLPHPIVVNGSAGAFDETAVGDVTLPHPLVVAGDGGVFFGAVTLPHPVVVAAAGGQTFIGTGSATLPHPLVVTAVGAPTFTVAAQIIDRLVRDLELIDSLPIHLEVLDKLAVDDAPEDAAP